MLLIFYAYNQLNQRHVNLRKGEVEKNSLTFDSAHLTGNESMPHIAFAKATL